jgi:hypothetical protein
VREDPRDRALGLIVASWLPWLVAEDGADREHHQRSEWREGFERRDGAPKKMALTEYGSAFSNEIV